MFHLIIDSLKRNGFTALRVLHRNRKFPVVIVNWGQTVSEKSYGSCRCQTPTPFSLLHIHIILFVSYNTEEASVLVTYVWNFPAVDAFLEVLTFVNGPSMIPVPLPVVLLGRIRSYTTAPPIPSQQYVLDWFCHDDDVTLGCVNAKTLLWNAFSAFSKSFVVICVAYRCRDCITKSCCAVMRALTAMSRETRRPWRHVPHQQQTACSPFEVCASVCGDFV
jgi:hypothetical protein